jgi:hypothetical protein
MGRRSEVFVREISMAEGQRLQRISRTAKDHRRGEVLARCKANDVAGCRRIQGELVRLGHPIGTTTAWETLTAAGIDPAARRSGPTWRESLTAQAEGVIACDFMHIDLVSLRRVYARRCSSNTAPADCTWPG